jgi:hypothetical protein
VVFGLCGFHRSFATWWSTSKTSDSWLNVLFSNEYFFEHGFGPRKVLAVSDGDPAIRA